MLVDVFCMEKVLLLNFTHKTKLRMTENLLDYFIFLI